MQVYASTDRIGQWVAQQYLHHDTRQRKPGSGAERRQRSREAEFQYDVTGSAVSGAR